MNTVNVDAKRRSSGRHVEHEDGISLVGIAIGRLALDLESTDRFTRRRRNHISNTEELIFSLRKETSVLVLRKHGEDFRGIPVALPRTATVDVIYVGHLALRGQELSEAGRIYEVDELTQVVSELSVNVFEAGVDHFLSCPTPVPGEPVTLNLYQSCVIIIHEPVSPHWLAKSEAHRRQEVSSAKALYLRVIRQLFFDSGERLETFGPQLEELEGIERREWLECHRQDELGHGWPMVLRQLTAPVVFGIRRPRRS